MESADAKLEAVDVEGVLASSETLLTDASRLWLSASLDQKQRLQSVLSPAGLKFDGQTFGTAVTCLAFRELEQSDATENDVVSPPGFEPGFQP